MLINQIAARLLLHSLKRQNWCLRFRFQSTARIHFVFHLIPLRHLLYPYRKLQRDLWQWAKQLNICSSDILLPPKSPLFHAAISPGEFRHRQNSPSLHASMTSIVAYAWNLLSRLLSYLSCCVGIHQSLCFQKASDIALLLHYRSDGQYTLHHLDRRSLLGECNGLEMIPMFKVYRTTYSQCSWLDAMLYEACGLLVRFIWMGSQQPWSVNSSKTYHRGIQNPAVFEETSTSLQTYEILHPQRILGCLQIRPVAVEIST